MRHMVIVDQMFMQPLSHTTPIPFTNLKYNYCQAYWPVVSRIGFYALLMDQFNFCNFPCSSESISLVHSLKKEDFNIFD